MKIFLIALAVFILTALAGCDTMPRQPPQIRNVLIKPSAALIQKCPISAPPNKEAFLKLDDNEQKKVLGQYGVKLQGDLKNCNDRWDTLGEWYVQQEKIHTKDNPK